MEYSIAITIYDGIEVLLVFSLVPQARASFIMFNTLSIKSGSPSSSLSMSNQRASVASLAALAVPSR